MTLAAPREGVILTAAALERAALAQLRAVLDTYAAAVADQLGGIDPPAAIRSYTCAASLDRWAEDALPAVVVVSPGILPPSIEQRGGAYSVSFGLAVGVFCSAKTEAATHDYVRVYAAAIRAALLQAPSLGGLVADLTWLSESYDDEPIDDRRSLAAGTVAFEVRVDAIVDAYAGPLVAADPPDSDPWPTVQATDVRIDKLDEEGGP